MDKIIFSITGAVNENDKKFLPKYDTYLLVGKKDKSINLVENQTITSLLASNASNKGYLYVGNIIIQWGSTYVAANSTVTDSFAIAFPNACLQIVGSQKENDTIAGLQIKAIDAETLQITISGGSENEIISWIAVGY